MSEHFHLSRFLQTRPVSEQQQRFEACEAEAGAAFAAATVIQSSVFQMTMSDLRGLSGPRYDRAREEARAVFARTTVEAAELCDLTVQELMQTGEISEELSYRWDQLKVSTIVQQEAA